MYKCERCGIYAEDIDKAIPCYVDSNGNHSWIHESEFTNEPKIRIPEFVKFLDDSKSIHIKKNQDYASDSNPFSNFEQSSIIASWFNDPVDKSFAVLIGTKISRIAQLRNSSQEAKNESIYDSFLDLGTYCFLWGSYIMRGKK